MTRSGTGCDRQMRLNAGSSFRDLNVWQESMILVEDIYTLSKRFPVEERFGLTPQLRRASVSIPSNGTAANHQTPTTNQI